MKKEVAGVKENLWSGEMCRVLHRVLASRVDTSIWKPGVFPRTWEGVPHDVTVAAEFDLVGAQWNLPLAKV